MLVQATHQHQCVSCMMVVLGVLLLVRVLGVLLLLGVTMKALL